MTPSARESLATATYAGSAPAVAHAIDHLLHERRRVIAAEEVYLSDLARHNALMRWRGLAPDHYVD
jgi:hypothetical protein